MQESKMEILEAFDLEGIPDGRADYLIAAMRDFAIENAPIATCPNCGEMVTILHGEGDYDCEECGAVFTAEFKVSGNGVLESVIITALNLPAKEVTDLVTVQCPACEMAGYSTRCLCAGSGLLEIDLAGYSQFDVAPVALLDKDGHLLANYTDPRGHRFEVVPEGENIAWAVYGIWTDGMPYHIADLPTREEALDFAEFLESMRQKPEIKLTQGE